MLFNVFNISEIFTADGRGLGQEWIKGGGVIPGDVNDHNS